MKDKEMKATIHAVRESFKEGERLLFLLTEVMTTPSEYQMKVQREAHHILGQVNGIQRKLGSLS